MEKEPLELLGCYEKEALEVLRIAASGKFKRFGKTRVNGAKTILKHIRWKIKNANIYIAK